MLTSERTKFTGLAGLSNFPRQSSVCQRRLLPLLKIAFPALASSASVKNPV